MSERVIGCPGCRKLLRILGGSPGQSTLFLMLAGGALGLRLIALIIALVVAYIVEKPQAGQAQQLKTLPPQDGGQLDGPRPRANPSQADRNDGPNPSKQAKPSAASPSGPAANPAGPNAPNHANATRCEAIVERIWQLADNVWQANKQARGDFPVAGGGVRFLAPPQAQQFAQRLEAINKELLPLITEAKQLPPPDAKLSAQLANLNAALHCKLLNRHNIRVIGLPVVSVPSPTGLGPSVGPAINPAEKALREFQDILDIGPSWTLK